MEIRIDKDWVITGDAFQFILNRKRTVKAGKNAGKEWLEVIGYYSTVERLVVALIHLHIRSSVITEIDCLGTEIERFGKLCQEAFTNHSAVVE